MLNSKLGNIGEQIAVDYLTSLNYKIIKRNFHFGKIGEIDIVAEDGDFLVFCEVKTRSNQNYGSGLDAINPKKQKQIVNVAKGYLTINKISDKSCRFDAIIINFRNNNYEIEHYKDIIFSI